MCLKISQSINIELFITYKSTLIKINNFQLRTSITNIIILINKLNE